MSTCKGYTKAGEPCRMKAGADGWCFNHRPGPEAEEARKEAARKGGRTGRAQTLSPEEVKVEFDSAQDVTGLLGSVCEWVLSGQIDARVANAAVYAASAALRSLDAGAVEEQIQELRTQIEELKGKGVRIA